MRPLMLVGTGSDVGKSVLVAGLCRIFRQDGYHPAPFKAQNMALNSFVTPDGLELGRAQAVQAEAAGIECMSEMNPVLLKPLGDCVSQVILNGKPIGNRSARDYFNQYGHRNLEEEVHRAFDRLCQKYDPIVMEGAGSIAELNLMSLDIVNMPMARYADAAVILVADISRGGVFASVYGSIVLQNPEDRKRIQGIIINKFRGDASLFADGRRMLEDITGVPVIGVMPFIEDLDIEEEDSYYSKQRHEVCVHGKINIAVVKLPHISNFTDFDPLEQDSRVNLYYTLDTHDLSQSDIIILPGTKSTISDLTLLYKRGVAQAIIDAYHVGKRVVGICGGYQMMGLTINDPDGVEGEPKQVKGLGLLPINTTISREKITRRVNFKPWDTAAGSGGYDCAGYEIHMGKSVMHIVPVDDVYPTTHAYGTVLPFAELSDGSTDGCRITDNCFGTYLHGLFENQEIVDSMLTGMSRPRPGHQTRFDGAKPSGFDYRAFKQSQYDRLAAEMRQYLDIDLIYKIISGDD